MRKRYKKWIAAGSIAVFVLLSAAVFWFVGRPLVEFLSNPDQFRGWVDKSGFWGRIAFIGMMVLQIVVAVIPGEPLEIGAGYAFGTVEGTILCLMGAVIGSALVFLFVRKCGIKAVEVFFPREKIDSLHFLQDPKRLNFWVFLVFFIPGTPKDMLSYVVGLTKMRFTTWLFISGFARIPSVITSTIGGDALGMGAHGFAVAVFIVTVFISLTGLMVYRKLCLSKKNKAVEAAETESLSCSSQIEGKENVREERPDPVGVLPGNDNENA